MSDQSTIASSTPAHPGASFLAEILSQPKFWGRCLEGLELEGSLDQIQQPFCVPNTFFNNCAFADPASGSFGDVSRNSVQGPGYQIWDFSVFKNFSITERTKLEFRAEFSTCSIIPAFSLRNPQNSINTTTFGTPQFAFLTGARDPRQIQLALKSSF